MIKMRGLWETGAVRAAALPLAWLGCLAGPAEAAEPAAPKTTLLTSRLNPADACGQCHVDIHRAWVDSIHARSYTDPVFQAALDRAASVDGLKARRLCLACHAPAATPGGDFEARETVSREGVGCDFCHSVKSVDLARKPTPFEVALDGVKRGPFRYLSSPAHGTEFSPPHKSSPLLCAGCHEYTSEAGAAVLSTYTEWKEGPYPAEGVSCQDCHMAIVPGDRVRSEVAGPQDQRIINLHRLVGGSSLSQLRRGLEIVIADVRREAGQVDVRVEVRNVAAGHKVPTGLPPKHLKLVVSALREGREVFSAERIYSRVLVDETGKQPATDLDLFMKSKRVASDTRLAPRETRREIFRFAAPTGELDL
jgi:hypothetical protein